ESAPTGRRGDVGLADGATARAVAARMNAVRPAGGPYVVPGDLSALSLLHEISHLLVERYETAVKPAARSRAADRIKSQLGADGDAVLRRFTEEFPSRAPASDDPASVVGELLLTRLANENPAATPLRELFDDRPLAAEVPYRRALEELETFFQGAGEGDNATFAGGDMGESLLEVLRAPARHAPTSLAGQLRYVRDHWAALLGDDLGGLLDRLEVTIGVLAEEEVGLHRRFGGGPGPEAGVHHEGPEFAGQETEVERFSSDSAWMPRLVLMAKATYVWLDQLSKRHERDISTLDAIPDSELDRLRDWGITGLWLIGLWQRSVASETIKRRRGNAEAVASAYSLDDYRIADDLGGEAAHANLRDRAWARGIRLASDMVPNHMGIDSRWVVEHPEWFLSVAEPPYPAYSFNGQDLSPDDRVSVVLEDHYWDATDAAVVFKHHDHASGISRYIYHGNDGTSFPWNDTAQLDFIKAEVREQVIQTILAVARRFPIIRFDAAMVLARKHVERLWWPLPGAGDGIPSRAEHAMRKAAFERLMPTEFWRDVVDRVAIEVPDTLLLAEAFWLMEGYFVRTLGMHRVYNSAFMHMLRDEDNAGYRKVIRETLEFDPAILERYVNFMSNPDEETALEQFGSGDKYLGVATLLVTLPGLPMFGHGQVEGFTEKYGMEFRRARLDERPDDALVARHEGHLFPLVHRRAAFAGSSQFLLYDFVRDDGTVDENVFAYSNGDGANRTLIVYHNTFAETTGRIRRSVRFAIKAPDGAKSLVTRSLAEALDIPPDPSVMIRYRDERSGLEYLMRAPIFHDRGLRLALRAYETRILAGFREVRDEPGSPWSRLAAELADDGVPSLDEALRDFELRPIHHALEAAIADTRRLPDLLAAIGAMPGRTPPTAKSIATETGSATERQRALEGLDRDAMTSARLGSWLVLAPLMTTFGPGIVDELRLQGPLEVSMVRRWNLDPDDARGLGSDGRALAAATSAPTGTRARLAAWLGDPFVAPEIGFHAWDGVDWLDGDRLGVLADRVALSEVLDGSSERGAKARATRLRRAAERAGHRVEPLRAPVRRSRRRSR
ncbi:MAG: alpha-amylase family glycosyl hydrolase, partial [Gemmatimonadales bacterium]